MLKEPFLSSFPNYLRFIFLLLIILGSLLLTLLIGLIVAGPVFGPGVFNALSDLSGEALMKNIDLQRYFQIISQLGAFIFPPVIYAYLVNKNAPGYLKLDHKPHIVTLFLALSAILVMLPFLNLMVNINESLRLPEFLSGLEHWMKTSEDQATEITNAFLSDTSIKGFIINIVMIGLLAALGEELLFRGILLRLLNDWFKNVHVAVILSAFLFSAMHLQFFGFLPRMILGIILGYLFIWSGNLWVPIITHLINNVLSVVVAFLFYKGSIKTDAESFGNTDKPVMIGISFMLTLLLLLLIFNYERQFIRRRDDLLDQ
jgi:membrane protease YdiL (CAAX protease family)